MSTVPTEFTPAFREEQFRNFLQEIFEINKDGPAKEDSGGEDDASVRRAVDDPKYKEFSQKHGKSAGFDKATQKFSLEFLLRIHFRKYEFAVVKKLVKENKVNKLDDLRLIISMLARVEKNFSTDYRLKSYREEILELKYLTYAKINIQKMKNKSSEPEPDAEV